MARISTDCKRSLHTETIATDNLKFSTRETIENPLASLARVMLCITVNILYSTIKFSKRARSVSGLQQVLTLGMETVIIFILYCTRKIRERARSASGLQQNLTWGLGVMRIILNKICPDKIMLFFASQFPPV